MRRIGFATLAITLAFLVGGAATASDIEWQIPVIRDAAGGGWTIGISREGTRQAATPFLTLDYPTLQEIEDRIVRMVKMTTRPETLLASLPPVTGEGTVRNMRGFLRDLRAFRKEKPVPSVVVPVPELRLGRAD